MTFIQSIIKNPTRSLATQNKASATVITNGYVLDLTAGLAVLGSSSSTVKTICGVANGSISAADALTQCSVIELFQNDVWVVDSTNNSDATHNGQDMILGANAGVVNNTGTTSTVGIVKQVGVYGAAADKKILVRFLAE